MAKVVSLGSTPVNQGEAVAINFLAENLPSNYFIYPNIEIPQPNGTSLECDAIVVTPHAVFVVEVKDWHGTIIGNDIIWKLGTSERPSPIKGVNHKSKVLKGLLTKQGPLYNKVWIEGLIVIVAKQTVLHLTGASQKQTFFLHKVADYLQSPARLLSPYPIDPNAIVPVLDGIKQIVSGMPVHIKAAKNFNQYRVLEELNTEEGYSEYLAENSLAKGLPPVRLRVFEFSPYMLKPDLQSRLHKIKNEYVLLQTVGSHPNLLPVQNLFEQDGNKIIEVTDWNSQGTTLEALILEEIPLTIERKLEIMRGLLAGIEVVHNKGVIHRAITPADILIGENYVPRLMNFDRARLDNPAAGPPTTVWVKPTEKEDIPYLAPELNRVDYKAYPASDLYSLGIIFYQLLTNILPVESPQEALKIDPSKINVSNFVEGLPQGLAEFINKMWQPALKSRYSSATEARQDFERILKPEPVTPTKNDTTPISGDLSIYTEYKSDDVIDNQYLVQGVLGRGGSSVVYKVYSPLHDQVFAMKVINQGVNISFLQKEFLTLKNLKHPFIARAEWAAQIFQAQYYLLTEFVEGEILTNYVNGKLKMNIQETAEIARNILDALEYLHTPSSDRPAILHRDIKPSNIVRTRAGLKIIDFNIAALAVNASQTLVGTPGYIAPDLAQGGWDASCDLFAAGVVLYQLVTQHHPFEGMGLLTTQSIPHDPHKFLSELNLSPAFVDFLVKVCMPLRKDRFTSAAQMRLALAQAEPFTVTVKPTPPAGGRASRVLVADEEWKRPDYNPYVTRFLTLFSQARRNNKGTRGLDDIAEATYVETRLDEKLLPAILEGRHPLVIITGNAGDGKTAFIQNLEKAVHAEGFEVALLSHGNGTRFNYNNIEFFTNYDGSQDEGENVNDTVLLEFFEPFAGATYQNIQGQVRLIAINEGRLRDFFETNWQHFPWLKKEIFDFFDESGDKKLPEGLLIVNLNLRSVVAGKEQSIFSRQLEAFGDDSFWSPCEGCSIKDRCFIKFNIDTFRDKVNGPEITERLRTIFETVHLRRRLHITMRDMRSALSYLIFRDHNCEDVATVLESTLTDPTDYLNKFYYNVLAGQDAKEVQQIGSDQEPSADIEVRVDRLIDLLTQIDVALVSNPQIDREMHFDGKTGGPPLFDLYSRSHIDEIMLETLQNNLTFGYEIAQNNRLISYHRIFHHMERRKAFFERREDGWLKMLPYEQLSRFREVTQLEASNPKRQAALNKLKVQIISGISVSEGSKSKHYNREYIWLRASQTDKPTIKSYRLFPASDFELVVMNDLGSLGEYLEYTPDNIILRHKTYRNQAELLISLDLMELLFHIAQGFKPSLNDLRGAYINLTIFRNSLSHLSFRELLLTENNRDFYRLMADEVQPAYPDQRGCTLMQLPKQDQVFRNPSIFHVDPKSINLDRTLLNLFILIKYDGYRPVSRKRPLLTIKNLMDRLISISSPLQGFVENEDIASKWLESDLVDMVNRGIAGKEEIAALRPLHLDSYKLRNPVKIRDYNSSDQVYSMLLYGDKELLTSLKEFLGKGLSNVGQTDSDYDDTSIKDLDLITLTIMRLVEGVDLIDQKGRANQTEIKPPLLLDQAQLMCDDIKRLLVYKESMPRHILIEYIKVMMGIHLALYIFRLAIELPAWLKNKQASITSIFDSSNYTSPLEMILDMGSSANSRIAQIAANSTAQYYNSINDLIRATFAVNTLKPFATNMGIINTKTPNPTNMEVKNLINLLADPPIVFEGYFMSKVNGLFADDPYDHVEKPEIEAIKEMQISYYDKYVELITLARSKFHKRYFSELLDATTQKNTEEGMLVQPQGSRKPRRFHIGSRLLEILVQIAVLEETGNGNYRTRVIRINEFIDWLRQRYGFVINGMESSYAEQAELADSEAFRQNIQSLKDRLREIGFYTDLSDAYNSQTIKPRYQID